MAGLTPALTLFHPFFFHDGFHFVQVHMRDLEYFGSAAVASILGHLDTEEAQARSRNRKG